mgnify:CR=1 FL=1|jgi:hypothetical protein|tara:strand:+ start:8754 stop:9167 length:414 start_codon:yes stop_codon:yes gene_type:complete
MPAKKKTKKVKVEKKEQVKKVEEVKVEEVEVEQNMTPTRYSVNVFLVNEPRAKNERIAQINWLAAGDKLVLAVQNPQYTNVLGQMLRSDYATDEGRMYSPASQPREWALNLFKVSKGRLGVGTKRWTASEAKASYAD